MVGEEEEEEGLGHDGGARRERREKDRIGEEFGHVRVNN